MKLFLNRITYFLLPFFLLLYPLDYLISTYLKQSNDYLGELEVWNDIYNSNINSDIVIYGSSRAWVHINPKIISDSLKLKAYNLGIDGHNFWLQYLRHKELLKHNKKPKTIILSVDIFSLQKIDDLYQPDQFLPFMLWNNNIYNFTNSYIGYKKIDYFVPLIRYIGKKKSLKTCIKIIFNQKPVKRYRINGFLGIDRQWNTDFEKFKAENKTYEIKFHQESVILFKKFIKECKDSNIKLILVYTPEYIEGQSLIKNRQNLINLYSNLSKNYELEFYDYSNHKICLDKTLFYNANHLNKKGADIFSRILAHDLKKSIYN